MSKIDRATLAVSENPAARPNRLTSALRVVGPAGLALGLLTAGCAGPTFYPATSYQTYPYTPRIAYSQPYYPGVASAPNMGQMQILSGDSANVFVPPAKTSSGEAGADEPFEEPKMLATPEEAGQLPAPPDGAVAPEAIEGAAASEGEAAGALEGGGLWEGIEEILILIPK